MSNRVNMLQLRNVCGAMGVFTRSVLSQRSGKILDKKLNLSIGGKHFANFRELLHKAKIAIRISFMCN